MQIESLLSGLYLIKPKVFEDHRGHFFENFREDVLKDNGVETKFVQDNQSLSQKGILRGLHFQAPPFSQGKFVRVIKGAVLDVFSKEPFIKKSVLNIKNLIAFPHIGGGSEESIKKMGLAAINNLT